MSTDLAPTPITVKLPNLHPSGLKKGEHSRAVYFISPAPTVPYDAVLEPIYWKHVANGLRPGDQIEVWPEDGSYWALLLVSSAGDNTAKVEALIHKQITGAVDEASLIEGYSISWRGPNGKYAVKRDADNNIVQSNFRTKEEAQTWMIQNKRQLAA
jgi:hypothetical protein